MLDHPNIVKIVEVFQKLNVIFIIMELCTGRSKPPLATDSLLENTGGVLRLLIIILPGRQPAAFYLC